MMYDLKQKACVWGSGGWELTVTGLVKRVGQTLSAVVQPIRDMGIWGGKGART